MNGATKRRGSALLLALFMMLGLIGLSVAFVRVTTQSARRLDSRFDDERAYQLAEAALDEAMFALAAGSDGAIGSQAAPAVLGDGAIWVAATELADGTVELVATALVGKGRSSLRAVADPGGGASPLFITTLNSDEGITLNEGVVVDSFDSKLGDYASQQVNSTNGIPHASMNGDVMSNQDVTLNANATAFGDAVPGPGHSVFFNTGSFVSGSTTPAPKQFAFPPIEVPVLPPAPSVSVPNNDSSSLPSGDYDLGSISIGKEATLRIDGPARIAVGSFTGGKDARLEIDATDGPVTIYCETSYTHTSGFEAVPVEGSPMAVAFFITAEQDIAFPAGTAVRGAYYAPEASIQFGSANEAWGAFAARRIEMSNSMRFHFDESLMEHWEEDLGQGLAEVRILSWSERAVEPAALQRDRRDPFLVLGVDPDDLTSPWLSWSAAP